MSLAFIFPGQGSQSVGMLGELAQAFSVVQETFAEASNVLGYDLWKTIQEGPEEKMNPTAVTQPAMLSAGVAVWRVWRENLGAVPDFMAGHSLGEYTALVCAEALEFAPAVGLVAERGRLMQEAVPAGLGAMAAILGIDDEDVVRVCEESAQGEVLSAVNFNSPGQVVIAGHRSAVERAVEAAREAGAKRAIVLAVSVPSHCSLMRGAAEQLRARLEKITIKAPHVPVINNVDVAMAQEPGAIRDALVRQLYSPVRWVETIQKLHKEGVSRVVECGPGKVLAGLNKRIERDMSVQAIYDTATLNQALAE
ncbi:MAG: [acyl-carrier-protein] S-malonyltransferase [Gammaproteobacteria bacterium RBG_16_57_12]|nr:MAG: [acyl-carrier-protein] S-malonyltransferase [Gammaproteobacteria bacterium RBG_16_57_12]